MIDTLLNSLDKRFWSKGRLETFTNWPFKSDDSTCTAERMAAAGFFVVEGQEENDVVTCFVCAKQLDGWEQEDDPWQEHAKHQKDCPFVLLNKQDEDLWTVMDLFNLIKAYYVKHLTNRSDEIVSNIKYETQLLVKNIRPTSKAERSSRKFL